MDQRVRLRRLRQSRPPHLRDPPDRLDLRDRLVLSSLLVH
jgi:hypothetical protein